MADDEQTEMETTGPRRSKRVTASDVAKAAGVSRPAVSRAFTPGAYLDKEKRALIRKTALQLGYRPNALAASLHGASTNLVGVVAGDLDNQFDAEFISHLIAQLNLANKWPLMLGGDEVVTEESILSILNYPLDALIIRGGSIPTSLIEDCAKLGIPLIFSGLVVDAPFTDCVCCKNSDGAAKAVNLLLERRRKTFGYLSGPATRSSANERLVGTIMQLEQAGLTLCAKAHADYSYEGGRKAALELLGGHELDALICANDAMALGALSAARNHLGISVPDDLSIVGFDDISMASWPDLGLTTIRNPLEETVSEILRLLGERLENPEKKSEVVMIDPILCERNTH